MSEDLKSKFTSGDSEKLTLILTSVEALESRVDSQLCPILHKMGADILQLQEGQRALSTELRAMRRDMDNRFGLIYGKLHETDIDDRNLHERVTRLELNANPPNSQT